jgi:hypothetical protein
MYIARSWLPGCSLFPVSFAGFLINNQMHSPLLGLSEEQQQQEQERESQEQALSAER